VDGIFLIDKPKGPTSFDVVKKVRKLTGVKRVGHAGTLDPLASGLMIVCVGKYTKLAGYLSQDNKTYESVITLGVSTSTDDAEGEVLSRTCAEHLETAEIHRASAKFLGEIEQLPPKFSAKKIQGQRAYKLARDQKEFTLVPRQVRVTHLAVTQISLPQVMITVSCSSGTYIRSIARDLGADLAVGGFAQEIRRVSSGAFDIKNALNLNDLNENNIAEYLLTGQQALGGLASIELSSVDKDNVSNGRRIAGLVSFEGSCAIATYRNEPVAILQKVAGEIKLARGF
jgi:tRNA pseudouridine55 synthase